MEPIEFKRMVLQFSRVGYVLTKTEVTAALKISYAIKKHLQRKALQSLAAFPREPSMMIYMADGWGASVSETLTKPVSGTHLVVTRKGRFRHEFLLQRGLVRQSLSTGEQKLFTLMEDPLGLSKGKGSWNVFSANLMFFPTLRHIGCTGVTINVYLLDGALFSALDRKFKAKHLLYYKSGLALGSDARRLQLSDWTVCMLCPSHVMSNGLKWGLYTVSTQEIVKNAHIATSACIRASSGIHKQVGDFVVKFIVKAITPSGSKDEVSSFWQMLGVDGDFCKEFVLLDINWDKDCLYVILPRIVTRLFINIGAVVINKYHIK
jgi:hypothetical protein